MARQDDNLNDSESNSYGMEIGTGRARRIWAFVGYLFFVGLVAGVLMAMFYYFTGTLRLAVVIVTMMLIYMAIMGWWASRNLEQNDGEMR